MATTVSSPRHARRRGTPLSRNRRRLVALTGFLSLGLIASLTSATAAPHSADHPGGGSRAPSEAQHDERGALEEHHGTLTVTEPGTVIDGTLVHGAINVRADDVTIQDSVVAYSGYHSIRIFPGADGTQILDTDVHCLRERTNGVVFGNYYAENVNLYGCRNTFMSSDRRPAEVVDSMVDGTPVGAETESTDEGHGRTPEPSSDPDQPAAPEPSDSSAPDPTPEPTSESSAAPDPGPSPTPEESPTPSQDPGVPGFPDATTTGVPDEMDLTPSDSLTITEDGTVVDGLHVRGTITIAADDVTVRNTLVQGGGSLYPIRVEGGTSGALIEHVEVDNLGDTGIGIFLSGSGTVRHADIHSAEDGIRIQSDDVTIEHSYIHDLQRYAGGHHDTIQIRSGDNITLRGNNLQPYVQSTDDPMNAALQIGSLSGDDRISNLLVVGNLMNGGNFTVNGGGRDEVDSARYTQNQFGRDFNYGPVGNLQHSVWESSNVWFDTGEPVR